MRLTRRISVNMRELAIATDEMMERLSINSTSWALSGCLLPLEPRHRNPRWLLLVCRLNNVQVGSRSNISGRSTLSEPQRMTDWLRKSSSSEKSKNVPTGGQFRPLDVTISYWLSAGG